jgi:chaperonin GroEL
MFPITPEKFYSLIIHYFYMSTHKTNIVTGNEAREGLLRGITIANDAVKGTMGPAGKNVVIEVDLPPYHIVTNDGATIIKATKIDDPLEKRGLSFIQEVVDRSNANSGDGSTTTTVLTHAIISEGMKHDVSGMEIKRSIDELLPVIENKINENKRIITEDEVEQVATISGESKELGALLGEIYKKIGKEGIIHLENSGTYETSYTFTEGVRFDGAGYLSPYMVRDEQAVKEGRKETRAVYENPTILVTKRKISHVNDIDPLIQTLTKQEKKDLVIFTDDMDSGVASLLVNAHVSRAINILIIKAPVLWKQYAFEDFAKCVGATIVEDSTGLTFKNLEMKHLGTCEKMVTDKEQTVLMGTKDIGDHLSALKEEGSHDSQLRLSWLVTKTAILKLGANSETELSYKRLKAEDAISASRLALHDGVVAGGGVCLADIAKTLPDTIGGQILKEALQAPMKQIMENMGIGTPNWGTEIVDASTIVKNAVRNAIGVASTVLTTNSVIFTPPLTEAEIAILSAKPKQAF